MVVLYFPFGLEFCNFGLILNLQSVEVLLRSYLQRRIIMSNTHCPGFESNKSLNEIKVKCPECGKVWEVFSDELEKSAKCTACGASVDPKKCTVTG